MYEVNFYILKKEKKKKAQAELHQFAKGPTTLFHRSCPESITWPINFKFSASFKIGYWALQSSKFICQSHLVLII